MRTIGIAAAGRGVLRHRLTARTSAIARLTRASAIPCVKTACLSAPLQIGTVVTRVAALLRDLALIAALLADLVLPALLADLVLSALLADLTLA